MRRVLVVASWVAAVAASILVVALADGAAGRMLSRGSWLLAFGSVAFDIGVYASVGAVLALRRPGNSIGVVLMVGGLLIATTFLGFLGGASLTAARGASDPAAGWASLIGGLVIYPAIICAGPALALLVPDGRLPGPRWQWPVAALVMTYLAGTAMFIGTPGPLGDSLGDNPLGGLGIPWDPTLSSIGQGLSAVTLPASLLLAVAAVVARFRRSHGIERQQLKWFVAANVLFATLMVLSFADGATEPTVFDIGAFVSLSFPAFAIGIAVLRYRLYEIDRIISRTVSWAAVSAILVAVFAGLVVGLQALLAGLTQGQTLAVAGSTLGAFGLFQPLRRRVQRAVDRRFDRTRYDAERIAARFAERLRDQVELEAVTADLRAAARESVSPTATSLWLRRAG